MADAGAARAAVLQRLRGRGPWREERQGLHALALSPSFLFSWSSPGALVCVNEHSLQIYNMVRDMQRRGIPVDGVGGACLAR
jgi:hypothetical protein